MAARSDAATDRVSLASAPAVASGLSMIVWVKIVVDRDDFSTICRFHQSSGSNTAITLGMKANGTQPALFSPGNTGGVTGTDLVVGTWTCVGFAVNASGVGALYRGTTPGTLTKFTGTVPISQTPDGMTFFGRSPSDATEWGNLSLAYARAWAGQLSDAEMAAESASATAVKTSGLFDHWAYAGAALTGVNGHTLTAGSTALAADTDPVLGTDINGVLTAPLAVASGTGTVVVSATGAATAPKATAAGTAGSVVSGSGAAVAPLAQATGSVSVVVTGSGALTAPPGAAAGAGTVAVGGTGALLAPAAAVSGTASVVVTASGDLVAPRAVVAGTGDPTPAIEGTGALVAPAPVVAGSGSVAVAGAGALTAPSPTVAGTATVVDVRHAVGALVAPTAVLSGVGHVAVAGVGAFVAPAAVVHGYDVAPQQRDITVHARLLPPRTTVRLLPSRWLVKEAP